MNMFISVFGEFTTGDREADATSVTEQTLLNAVKVPPSGDRTRGNESPFISRSASMNVHAWVDTMG